MPSIAFAQIPTFQIVAPESKVNFHVNASVELTGVFEKWSSTLTFSTPYGSPAPFFEHRCASRQREHGQRFERQPGKLKGSDFFDVKANPEIRFLSKKIVNTGLDAYRVDGDFTIRGLTNEESLILNYQPDHPDEGRIRGQMVFDRRQYGMTHSIPLIKIADRVEVGVDLKIHRTSGPRPIQQKN